MIEELRAAGIDVDACLKKFMGSVDLFTKYAVMFKNDTNYEEFKNKLAAGENDLAIHYIHTLKGSSGQLGFEALFEVSNNILIKMREGDVEYAKANLGKLEEEYLKIKNIVSKY